MSITATVENGIVKLPVPVPDGTQVEITLPDSDEGPTHYELMKEYIGFIKDGPTDLAAEHDHYAHGAPKQGQS